MAPRFPRGCRTFALQSLASPARILAWNNDCGKATRGRPFDFAQGRLFAHSESSAKQKRLSTHFARSAVECDASSHRFCYPIKNKTAAAGFRAAAVCHNCIQKALTSLQRFLHSFIDSPPLGAPVCSSQAGRSLFGFARPAL
jgi:hypothetical protein